MTGGFAIPSNVFSDAINYFWSQRSKQAATARGGEGQGRNVRGGMHLDGVQATVVRLLIAHGVSGDHIFTDCELHKTGKLELPGYFRPAKKWDLLVVRGGRLLAAMELKAQVGPSFGNNFNNRTEEAMGSAFDLWTAFREGAFGQSPQPWLGYLFVLEDHPDSNTPVRNLEPHFNVLKEFDGASYAKRYELFCRKLVRERAYSAACFLMSTSPEYGTPRSSRPVYSEPAADLNAQQFLSSFLRAVVPL